MHDVFFTYVLLSTFLVCLFFFFLFACFFLFASYHSGCCGFQWLSFVLVLLLISFTFLSWIPYLYSSFYLRLNGFWKDQCCRCSSTTNLKYRECFFVFEVQRVTLWKNMVCASLLSAIGKSVMLATDTTPLSGLAEI